MADPRKTTTSTPALVQLDRNHAGHQVGETFTPAEAKKANIPGDFLKAVADRAVKGSDATTR